MSVAATVEDDHKVLNGGPCWEFSWREMLHDAASHHATQNPSCTAATILERWSRLRVTEEKLYGGASFLTLAVTQQQEPGIVLELLTETTSIRAFVERKMITHSISFDPS